MKPDQIPIAFPLLLLALLFSTCGGQDAPANEESNARVERQAAINRLENPEEVAALGKVRPMGELLELAFETGGRVMEIHFKEGQRVPAGAPLLTLDAALEDNQLKTLGAQLERNRLEQEDARAQQRYYEEVLEQYQQTYQRLKRSVDAGALPAGELDPVELNLSNTRNQAASAARLQQRLEAQARELRLKQEEVRLRRQQKELMAPEEGTVIRWEVRPGSMVSAQQPVGEFAPAGPLILEAEVDEYFATNVRVGQHAIIRREGYADTLARGQVTFTADRLSEKSVLSEDNSQFEDLQVRRIKIRLEDDSRLLLGMKVEAVIQTAENR